MYDLLLKGGTVVDPSVGLNGVHDIAVQDGTIALIDTDIFNGHVAIDNEFILDEAGSMGF